LIDADHLMRQFDNMDANSCN